MSEVKRPTRPTWSFNWPKSLTQYADDMDRWVAELEAERDQLRQEVSAVLNAVGYEAQLHEHHSLHEFNEFIAALEDTHE